MKKVTVFLLIALLMVGMVSMQAASAEETIKLVVPQVGYNADQIAAAEEEAAGSATGTMSPNARYHIAVTNLIAETYPNYEVEYVDWGWAETLDQKQRALIAAGDVPDIVAGETFIPTYAMEGVLEPLPEDIVALVDPSFLVYDADGVAVAVAQKSSIFMLFYNKDLMAMAGLDPETPPTTWAEWKEMSDAITAAGNGEYYGGGIPSFPHAGGSLRATPFFRQMGTDFAIDGQPNLSDAALQETLQFIRDMNANFPMGLGNQSDEGPLWTAFEQSQTIAFVVNGSWEAGGATSNGLNWGVVPLPLPEGGQPGNCLVGSVYLGVPKEAKNKEASFNLIRAALDYDAQLIWLEDRVCTPLLSIINDTSLYEADETLATAMEALRSGQYSGLATFAKNDTQVWEIITTKVLAKTTMTDEDIATICEDAMNEILPLMD